ncbi:ribosome maturation factor RimM [Gallaecimonas kandeliae]|uniref:ribosome maturation factor RimM n=1 Tax=Gallaecimonas kandeliae TaxID=3029055 RepID=UPI002648A1D3|nr:ribosome maturation factor RimM [Gallaecimonas kandeliae]WKE66471.1 ribosome maturation factor RimM [Gallaecimonas kandeliae]
MEKITVGRLGAPYGIRGWVKVNSFTDDPENIFSYQPWLLGRDGDWQERGIVKWRRHNKGLVVLLDQVTDRNGAELLNGMDIAVEASQLPELADGDYYWRDLEGLRVVNLQGYDLGQVDHLMETGSNDVLVVKANSRDSFGQRERLIPFVTEQFIKKVDIPGGVIEVDWDPSF